MSEQHASTYEAMVAVMAEVTEIAKSRETDSGARYKFRGIEELLEALAPACRKHGLVVAPSAGEPIASTYTTKSGTAMFRTLLPVRIEFHGSPDNTDVIVASGVGEAADAGDKSVSKAYSVGFREVMFKAFVIPTRGGDYDTEQGGDVDRGAGPPPLDWAGLGWQSQSEHDDALRTNREAARALPGDAKDRLKVWWDQNTGAKLPVSSETMVSYSNLIDELRAEGDE